MNEDFRQAMVFVDEAICALEEIGPDPTDVGREDLRPFANTTTSDAITVAFHHVRGMRFGDLTESADDPAQRLRTLHALASLKAEIDREWGPCVQQAKALGASWTQIGEAMGMTKQAAQQRFG